MYAPSIVVHSKGVVISAEKDKEFWISETHGHSRFQSTPLTESFCYQDLRDVPMWEEPEVALPMLELELVVADFPLGHWLLVRGMVQLKEAWQL